MLDFLINHSPLLYLTQSLWRDEAYSILSAQHSLEFLLTKITLEPPLYYILLHFWMKIFGTSEIATRMLSFVGFSLATGIVIYWAEKIYKKHWLSWYLPLFFFLNPMLLYYGFEVRTYGWYIFFATASMYSYLEKRWLWFILATTLGFYTHTYMVFVPFVEAIHWLIANKRYLAKSIKRDPFARSLCIVGLLALPWFYRIAYEVANLKSSWYFPVDIHLVRSVLGNMFLGYEGTPGGLWIYTYLFSIILLFFFILALKEKARRKYTIFFLCMAIVPLVVVIGISFKKPLFVNRYLIPVTIAEVFLLVYALASIKKPIIQKIFGIVFMIFVIGFNSWYPSRHAKLNIRSTLMEINALKGKNDIILAGSPLILFETIYYAKHKSAVFLYNPEEIGFPWYVGGSIVSPSQMKKDLPIYPQRAFLIHENGTFDVVYNTPIITL